MGELKIEPSSDSLDNVETAWKEAGQSYAHAYQFNTNDVDAALQLEFCTEATDLDRGITGRQCCRAKQQADEAVRRNEYHRALEIMESLNNPIANKKFQDMLKN